MKEYGLYHFKKCWFKTHIVLFSPFWALYEKGSCVGYICIVWSILMINTSMASKEVRLLSKEEGRKESSIGLLSSTYYLVLWEAIIWKSPSPPIPPTPHHITNVNILTKTPLGENTLTQICFVLSLIVQNRMYVYFVFKRKYCIVITEMSYNYLIL